MTLRHTSSILFAIVLSGCFNSAPTSIDKNDARQSKADGVTDKLCKAAGEEPGCDICEVQDWYEDGECDDFCARPDPDCPIETCAALRAVVLDCAETADADDCVPADGSAEHDLGMSCCEQAPYEYCDAIGGALTIGGCIELDDEQIECIVDDGTLDTCLLDPNTPEILDTATACCSIELDLEFEMCFSLIVVAECEALPDMHSDCVFDFEGSGDADVACAQDLFDLADDCCEIFAGSQACEIRDLAGDL